MLYALGVLTGLIIAVIVFLATKRYETKVERTLKQMENFTKEKGEVFVPDEQGEEMEYYLNNLPKE